MLKQLKMEIEPARRVNNVSEYYFSTKLKEIDAMKAAGKDVINLGIGSPDLPPSEATIEALCKEAHKPNVHGYQSYIGIPELRNGFAEWYKKWFGVELNPNTEIQPLIGSKEGILHISLAFLNPGDGVLVPNPGYPTYTSVSNLCEAKVIPYDLDENHEWQPDFDALEKMNLEGVKLMWTNYPNMPTGANASVELFEKLVAFGKKHNIIICNDNPYSFILNDRKLSILSVDGAKDICIEMNSMSKSHNMAGWRIAMLASNRQFVEWVLRVKSNVDSGMFRPMMIAAAEALKNPKEWHDQINVVYARRRNIAFKILDLLGCTYDTRQVGLFVWGKIPDRYKDAGELADEILYGKNVFITPGFIFGDKGNRYVRISLCCPEPTLEEVVRRIEH
ncbi:MAG TPA: aminotransferase class I/II-fold pyridoxal phosphate-dependent enzyme [Paludibacteraceae bacterium]|nr:aminotransferase class I/II-fold pyridoxal phosphate-dependent enzyme [Paludibacteraceae bacterium]HOL29423.1 aminotransferase class I/II-fold pyridoxal phosphate-dependent enzyme [Paludibacteraceae bacterium]HON01689.1 aminotransferase class I/II-fold pyridoxal phosphate-dependent enzyme [Paludibacteraceae bacterium]HPD58455.1 aminotransferase class I/II-fold pyridoxal phosphate-dependent enzyme [Paludibacteraceae bacterium]HPQ12058.1 aminotransferase class I/II-fold pyridoxal phosphate-dep